MYILAVYTLGIVFYNRVDAIILDYWLASSTINMLLHTLFLMYLLRGLLLDLYYTEYILEYLNS